MVGFQKVYELLPGQKDTRYKHSSVLFNLKIIALLIQVPANGDCARLAYTAKLLCSSIASPQVSICCPSTPIESKRKMSFSLILKAHRLDRNVDYLPHVPTSSPVTMMSDDVGHQNRAESMS